MRVDAAQLGCSIKGSGGRGGRIGGFARQQNVRLKVGWFHTTCGECKGRQSRQKCCACRRSEDGARTLLADSRERRGNAKVRSNAYMQWSRVHSSKHASIGLTRVQDYTRAPNAAGWKQRDGSEWKERAARCRLIRRTSHDRSQRGHREYVYRNSVLLDATIGLEVTE